MAEVQKFRSNLKPEYQKMWDTYEGICNNEKTYLEEAARKFAAGDGSDIAAEHIYEKLKKQNLDPPGENAALQTFMAAGRTKKLEDFCNLIW